MGEPQYWYLFPCWVHILAAYQHEKGFSHYRYVFRFYVVKCNTFFHLYILEFVLYLGFFQNGKHSHLIVFLNVLLFLFIHYIFDSFEVYSSVEHDVNFQIFKIHVSYCFTQPTSYIWKFYMYIHLFSHTCAMIQVCLFIKQSYTVFNYLALK